jgi:hypothetical protein
MESVTSSGLMAPVISALSKKTPLMAKVSTPGPTTGRMRAIGKTTRCTGVALSLSLMAESMWASMPTTTKKAMGNSVGPMADATAASGQTESSTVKESMLPLQALKSMVNGKMAREFDG